MQPVFSPSVLAEMIRPDGSSTVSVISGESLSAELAHELMSIQVNALKNCKLYSFHGPKNWCIVLRILYYDN